MKNLTKRLTEVFAVALLLTACVVSAGQLTTTARASEAPPACAGLTCWDASDCGSKCFCNRPSSTCYSDVDEVE